MINEFNCVGITVNIYPGLPASQPSLPPHYAQVDFYFDGDRAGAKKAFTDLVKLAEQGTVPIKEVYWERDYAEEGEEIEAEHADLVAQWPAPAVEEGQAA